MLFSAKIKYVWENKQNWMSSFVKTFLQIWLLYLQPSKYFFGEENKLLTASNLALSCKI